MIEKKLQGLFFILLILSFILVEGPLLSGYCQSESSQKSEITITGRLYLDQHGREDWLVLHSKDRKAYMISGALIDSLTNIVREKKDTNIVTLSGIIDPKQTTRSCDSRNDLEYNSQNQKVINRKSSCIRYYHFDAQTIVSRSDSNETLPALERDTVAEEHMQTAPLVGDIRPAIIGEIYGTIRQLNLRSPLKTVEIRNTDKNSALKSITVIITGKTRIARAVGNKEPVMLLPQNLKVGQQVVVMYSRDELKTEALSIAVKN
jgi:hypothetical protein